MVQQQQEPHRAGRVLTLETQSPRVHSTVWLAPGSVVVGDAAIGPHSSVWYNAVVRGDSDSVTIGARSNIQDGAVVHTQKGNPAILGDDVSVGHNAVVHGARIGDGCLIGMSATVLSGAVVEDGALIAAGALVPQGMRIPKHTLAAGVPARLIRELTDAERIELRVNAERYLGYTATHASAAYLPTEL